MTVRVASSRLTGRSAELAVLETARADAADGRPSLAFVAGESGVGKTRLLAELMRRARDAGTLVLAGETADFSDEGELPYLPLVAALRPLARGGDPVLTPPVREAIAAAGGGVEPSLALRRRATRALRRSCSRVCCRFSMPSGASARCCS